MTFILYRLAKVSEKVNIGSALIGTRRYNFSPPYIYADPQRHNAQRHRRTDRQTDDSMMPIVDRIHVQQYDRLKMLCVLNA